MKLADIHAQRQQKVWPCKIRTILAGLSEQNREWLSTALDDTSMTHTEIVGTLQEAGIATSDASVKRHRHEKCSCRWLEE